MLTDSQTKKVGNHWCILCTIALTDSRITFLFWLVYTMYNCVNRQLHNILIFKLFWLVYTMYNCVERQYRVLGMTLNSSVVVKVRTVELRPWSIHTLHNILVSVHV